MKILPIRTKSKNYNIYIGENIISKIDKIINNENIKFKKALIVVDKKIPKNFLKKLLSKIVCDKKIIFLFNASEKNKNLNSANAILELLFINNFTRNDIVICLGGGITGDVACFAASI